MTFCAGEGMRFAVTALLLGCNGDNKTTEETGSGDTETTPEVCDIPPFDLEGRSCEQLRSALDTTLAAADFCTTADDCWIFRAQCEQWNAVGCYYASNDCVDQTDLNEFNAAAASGNCNSGSGQICDCGGPPEVDCVSGRCQLVYSY